MASRAVAKATTTALAIPDEFKAAGRMGLEEADSESFAVPFLMILQKMSPQADPDSEAYIEGAKAGMLYDTVTSEVIDPDKEDVFILPVFYKRSFVEWKTREDGGGFVAEHPVESGINLKATRDGSKDILPNGHQIVDTRAHYVVVCRAGQAPAPMLLSLSSTQVKKSKRLNSDLDLQMRSQGLQATFQLKYKVTTVPESNEHGSWRGWKFERVGLVDTQDEFDTALAFYKALRAGEVKVAHDSLATAGAGESTDDDDIAF